MLIFIFEYVDWSLNKEPIFIKMKYSVDLILTYHFKASSICFGIVALNAFSAIYMCARSQRNIQPVAFSCYSMHIQHTALAWVILRVTCDSTFMQLCVCIHGELQICHWWLFFRSTSLYSFYHFLDKALKVTFCAQRNLLFILNVQN